MDISSIVKKDFLIFDPQITLTQMIGKLKVQNKRVGFVFDKGEYKGIVEKRKILRSQVDASSMKIAKVVHMTPILEEGADLVKAASLMEQSNVEYLPVKRDNHVVGIVGALDIVQQASILPSFKKLKVADFTLDSNKDVSQNDPLSKAIHIIHENNIHNVPVLTNGELSGVLSQTDILSKFLVWSSKRTVSTNFTKMQSSRGARPDINQFASLPVKDFSTNNNLVTVQKKDSLLKAIQEMEENNVSDVLVLIGKDFEGLLTLKTLIHHIAGLEEKKNYQIEYKGLTQAKLTMHEKESLLRIVEQEAEKIQRKLKVAITLTLHLKEHNKDARKQKHSWHLRVEGPGILLTSSQDDWDFVAAVQRTFEHCRNEIEKEQTKRKKVARRG